MKRTILFLCAALVGMNAFGEVYVVEKGRAQRFIRISSESRRLVFEYCRQSGCFPMGKRDSYARAELAAAARRYDREGQYKAAGFVIALGALYKFVVDPLAERISAEAEQIIFIRTSDEKHPNLPNCARKVEAVVSVAGALGAAALLYRPIFHWPETSPFDSFGTAVQTRTILRADAGGPLWEIEVEDLDRYRERLEGVLAGL